MAAKPLIENRDLFGNVIQPPKRSPLSEKFLVPPFSVLDARQGYWQERKAEWLALGVAGEEGRKENLLKFSEVCNSRGGYKHGVLRRGNAGPEWGEEYDGGNTWRGAGSSVFDPVLCELIYRWFVPEAGKILDPFAGGSTRGVVANFLGYRYTGIEVRAEQVEANKRQAEKIKVAPCWITGDSARLLELIIEPPYEEKFDAIFTCPPYFDLERYTDDENLADGSAFESYEKFMLWYADIFRQAIKLLKWNRFLIVVVGEIRCEKGFNRNFVGDNISCFLRLGLRYYNEAILVTSIGSLPIRVGKQFGGARKLGKTHQNILVFYNGSNCEQIKEKFGKMFDSE